MVILALRPLMDQKEDLPIPRGRDLEKDPLPT